MAAARWGAVCWATLATLAGAASAMGDDATVAGSDCSEAVAAVPISAERADAVLPDGWRPILGDAGLAVLGVGIARCEEFVVGAAAIGSGSFSDVGVLVEAPPGASGGPHFYQLWQHTDVGALHGLTSRAGVAGARTSVDLRMTPWSPLATSFIGEVGRGAEAYEIAGTAGPSTDTGSSAPTWWHDGRHGRVRLGYSLQGTSTRGGPTTLRVAPGSPLEELLGTTSTQAAGLLITIPSLRAHVTVP